MMGFDRGRTTVVKNRKSLAPSIREVSSSSCGMVVWKNVRVTMSYQTLTQLGRMSAHGVFSSPS